MVEFSLPVVSIRLASKQSTQKAKDIHDYKLDVRHLRKAQYKDTLH